jgi:hypothetical protein
MVGGFSALGLGIYPYHYDYMSYGMAAMRKFA